MANVIKPTAAKPIGITIPIEDSNSGYFAQSFDTMTQIKNNIVNLLNTRPGERRFQPTFGTRLWNLVFEQNIDTLKDEAVNIVNEDIMAWVPNVTVTDITANLLTSNQINVNTDMYMLEVAVTFVVNLTKQSDTVIVTINNSNTLTQ
jgi:phage baseplate assembly protein W